MPSVPVLGRQRQVCDFKANLVGLQSKFKDSQGHRENLSQGTKKRETRFMLTLAGLEFRNILFLPAKCRD